MSEAVQLADPAATRHSALRSLVRAALATARARTLGQRPIDYATKTWPNDRRAGLILRGATSPTDTIEAAALQTVAFAFFDAMRSLTASALLFDECLKLQFGKAGTIRVPTFAPGTAGFVGEKMPKPTRQFAYTGVDLPFYNFATLVSATNEIVSSVNAETLLRSVLLESAAVGLDEALFSNAAAVAKVRPAGLRNGIAPLSAATGTGKTDAMQEDLISLLTAILPAAGRGDVEAAASGVYIIAAPRQAVAIQYRLERSLKFVRASTALPVGTVMAVATQALVVAIDPPRIDVAKEAMVHEDDAAPVVDIGSAALVRSMWQTDSQSLRLVMPLSWGLRAPNAVMWMQGVSW